MNQRRLGCTVMLSALAIGCADTDVDRDPVTEEGSPEAVQVDPDPMLKVGVQAGDPLQEFHDVRMPFDLSDGRLAVPLGGEGVIRLFDGEGASVESFGGEGEGPGEFAELSSAWARGDTIEAADGRLRRITRFLPDGSVDVIRLLGAEAPGGTMPPGPVQGGWVTANVAGSEMNGRDLVAVHGFSRDGAYLGELAQTEGIKRTSVAGGAGPHPLSPRAVVRIGNDEVYVGETESARIRVFDLHGNLEREITWVAADGVHPEEALRMVREAPDSGPGFEHLLSEAPAPERLSVFWDFLVDELGFVWVQPYDPMKHAAALGGLGGGDYMISPGGGGGRWVVLSPDGETAGSVEVPEGLRPTHIRTDHLVGIHVDTLGVQSVQVHSLSRN